MDGDQSAKTMEQGANSAMKDQDLTSGIHESTNQIPGVGDKTTGAGTSLFSKDGSIGKMFNADGAIGGTAQSIGGPFDKEGAVGKNFNADGKIGGMIQENLANKNSPIATTTPISPDIRISIKGALFNSDISHYSPSYSDMPAASKPPPKRKAPAFKPPRPASKAKATTETSRRKSAPARTAAVSISSSDDELASSSIQGSPEPVAPPATEEPPPTIPPKLLTRILHHHFKDSDIRIGKDANELIGKYMEMFVREAITRATYERSEADGGGLGGEFLEVEDLEKLAPQLIMDF